MTSYNFPSLLNLPEAMQEYGPLKNLWEGGYQGEGFLLLVKPEASYGMRKNWCCSLHDRILCTKAIDNLEAGIDPMKR